jgi:hypothetical protein
MPCRRRQRAALTSYPDLRNSLSTFWWLPFASNQSCSRQPTAGLTGTLMRLLIGQHSWALLHGHRDGGPANARFTVPVQFAQPGLELGIESGPKTKAAE